MYLSLVLAFASVATTAGAQAKINKKNMVVKEWKTETGSNTRVLDRITTYNSDGKKVEEIEYGSKGQKWRKRYEYGADGKNTRELVYDEKNRLQLIKKFDYNEFGRKKTQYNYNANGKLLSIKVYEYHTEDA